MNPKKLIGLIPIVIIAALIFGVVRGCHTAEPAPPAQQSGTSVADWCSSHSDLLDETDRAIVVPYTGPVALGALLALDVHDGVAEGRAVGEAGFMPMRGQRLNQNDLPPYEGGRLSVRVDQDATHIFT